MADLKPEQEQTTRQSAFTEQQIEPTTPIRPPTYYEPVDPQKAPLPEPEQPKRRNTAVVARFHKVSSMLGSPLNKAANIVGAEGWWPSSMEREANKAARILHSFTVLGDPQPPKAHGPMHPTGLSKKSMSKIPAEVLRSCAGFAIFNTFRVGVFNGTIAGGSGLVVARRPDGTWSPPSTFVLGTLGAGLSFGLDLVECVCVLNTPAQVAAFTKPRVSLGGDAAIAVGPLGTGRSVEAAVSKTAKPVWSYMKTRGLWLGVQIDGTVMLTRADANAVAYGEQGISAAKILQGDTAWPLAAKALFEVLKTIDGRIDYEAALIQHMAIAPEGEILDDKRSVTSFEVVDKEGKVEKEETILDEKQRLAASGY